MKKIIMLICMAFIVVGCSSNKTILKLNTDTYKVELGQEINTDIKTYLNLEEVPEKEKEALLATAVTMSITDTDKVTKDDKTFVKVGEYTGTITYKTEEVKFKVIVQDTTQPVLTYPETIEIVQGDELNLEGKITASDLNDLEVIQYDTSAINKDEPGEYILKFSVKDKSGNETAKELKVIVKAKAEANEDTPTEDSNNDNNTAHTPSGGGTTSNTTGNGNNQTNKPSTPPVDQSLAASLSASNNTTQLLTVIGTGGTTADFALHEKRNGVWTEVYSCNARVGTNGIGPTTEWSRTTPNGVFSLGMNFGINPNPGATYGYTQVNNNHYWVDDVNSKYYNQFVDTTKVTPDWSSAEHIVGFPGYYNYCVNINYNPNCTPAVGSAIFIHCDIGSATYGCVAIPEDVLAGVMQRLQGDALIAIYPSYDSLY